MIPTGILYAKVGSNWEPILTAAPAGGSGITQSEADARYVNLTGDEMSGTLSFGNRLGQHISLYGGTYGWGVQTNTVYQRVTGSTGQWAWHQGGTHDDASANAGGGVRRMLLQYNGTLFVGDPATPANNPNNTLELYGNATRNLINLYVNGTVAGSFGFDTATGRMLIKSTTGEIVFDATTQVRFTDPVTLAGAPTIDLHAVTKKYVDDADAIHTYGMTVMQNYLQTNYTQKGSVNVPLPVVNTNVNQAVTFPKEYSGTPRVVCQVRSTGASNSFWATQGVTTTGFSVNVERTGGVTSRDVDWIAVGPVASL